MSPVWAEQPINMAQAAESLGISRRTLVDVIKEHPQFEWRGRRKVFYTEHMRALCGVLRVQHEPTKLASRYIANELVSLVRDRDGNVCLYCEEYTARWEIDHVIPLCRGGGNELSNLATSCPKCNRQKGAKTGAEYINWREDRGMHAPDGALQI